MTSVQHRVGVPQWWAWAVWVVANALGLALFLLVESDDRLVTLGRDHGPSAAEALGAVLVIGGWVVLDVVTVRSWASTRWTGRTKRVAAAVAVIGVLALVPAVIFASGWSWIPGATLLAGVQLAAALSVRPRADARRRA